MNAPQDKAAFKSVYKAHAGLVHFVAMRAGLAREEAEDVVQETFVRLFQKAADIRDSTRLSAWLTVTARNLAIDRLRSRRRLVPTEGEVLEGSVTQLWEGHADGPRHELEVSLIGRLLDKLATTPGGETLRQFYGEGMSTKEIAAQNGEAISTVTTRLSRLRAKFKDELKRHIEELRSHSATE